MDKIKTKSAKEHYRETRSVETRNWTPEMVFNFAEEYASVVNKPNEAETNKRFFFFVYSFWIDDSQGKGNLFTTSKSFPDLESIKSEAVILAANKFNTPEHKITVVIENWKELSEEDYTAFLLLNL